ncbi:hypothetical protein C7M84_006069 [Penaeus vannamei]|uniref:Uncharacterized protein n=1 Tax=Penaeus vannamei TaxID=6689 RepID=A0A3R7P4S8_PENVA|nr:hypothetical protein C7M84_006069 [Penaeus vannamei]
MEGDTGKEKSEMLFTGYVLGGSAGSPSAVTRRSFENLHAPPTRSPSSSRAATQGGAEGTSTAKPNYSTRVSLGRGEEACPWDSLPRDPSRRSFAGFPAPLVQEASACLELLLVSSPPALAPRVPQQGLLSLLLHPADLLLEGAPLLLVFFELLPHPSELLLEGADVLLPAPNPQAARIRARVGLHLVPGGEPKEFALAVCQELGQEVLSGRDEVAAVGAPSRGQPAQDVLDLLLELLEVALASENLDVRVVSVHVNPDPMQVLQLLDPAASEADDGAAPLLSQGHGEPVAAVRAEAVAAVLLRSLAGDPGSLRSHRKDYNKYKLLGFSGRLYGESGGLGPHARVQAGYVMRCAPVVTRRACGDEEVMWSVGAACSGIRPRMSPGKD